MTNNELLNELYRLGRLPDAGSSASNDFPFDKFDRLLRQLTTPVTKEEAVKLMGLSPPVDTGNFGVEWALVHLIETIATSSLQYVLDNAEDGEVKRLIQLRLNGYLNSRK